jgi:hypothetical protein
MVYKESVHMYTLLFISCLFRIIRVFHGCLSYLIIKKL